MFGLKTVKRNGTEFFVEGRVTDGNVVIVTKDGKEHRCDKPNRVGLQSGTPWLMNTDEPREGDRCWNINLVEIMNQFNTGDYYKTNPFFVIGKWGTGYNEDEGVLDTVRLEDVAGFRELHTEAPCEIGCSWPKNHSGNCWVTPDQLVKDLNLSKEQVVAMFQKWFDGLSASEVVNLGFKVGLTSETLIKMVKAAK